MNQQRRLILRISVTIVGLGLVVWLVDVPSAWQVLQTTHLGLWLMAFALFQAGMVIRALRWQSLLIGVDVPLSLPHVLKLYYTGMFFNLFLPTGFGGDAVRAGELAQDVDGASAVATVLLDRMMGLLTLFVLAVVLSPLAAYQVPTVLWFPAILFSIVGLLVGILLLHGGLLSTVLGWATWLPFITILQRFNEKIRTAARNRRAIISAILYSLVFNGLLIALHGILAASVDIEIGWIPFVLIVPLTSVLLMVPSIQGLGLRESALVGLLAVFGVGGDSGLALGLVIFSMNLVTGLLGGGVYLFNTHHNNKLTHLQNP